MRRITEMLWTTLFTLAILGSFTGVNIALLVVIAILALLGLKEAVITITIYLAATLFCRAFVATLKFY